jgi:MFS family permease
MAAALLNPDERAGAGRDRLLVWAAAFLRAVATGMLGVLLGLHLLRRGLDPAQIGVVVTAGLLGAAAAALLVMLRGERIGCRRSQVAIAVLCAIGTAALAFTQNVLPAAAAACLGMVNGMGRDRGAALVLDQAILPRTIGDSGRTLAFARYHLLQDAGHALGALAAGLPALFQRIGIGEHASLRLGMLIAASAMLTTAVLYARLTPDVNRPIARVRVDAGTRRLLWRIAPLFALDSLGSGFLGASLLTVFFHEHFAAGEAMLGALFAAAGLANAVSHLGAAWLARRIGLVNTMVFTHIPSSLILAAIAWAPDLPTAAVLFLLREGLVEMDVPTRQSYVMAVVRPEERTFVAGVTHLVRLGAWAVAPAVAGVLMQNAAITAPLLVGAGIKIAYDVLLYFACRKHPPPEEVA